VIYRKPGIVPKDRQPPQQRLPWHKRFLAKIEWVDEKLEKSDAVCGPDYDLFVVAAIVVAAIIGLSVAKLIAILVLS
jgi:hypothetical protein